MFAGSLRDGLACLDFAQDLLLELYGELPTFETHDVAPCWLGYHVKDV